MGTEENETSVSEALGVPTIDLLQNYFLEASARGWAGNGPETILPDLPGARMIRIMMGLIVYEDVFWTHPGSDHSFGLTTMIVRDFKRDGWFPVWYMQYAGQYPKWVLKFLKQALRTTYQAGEFVGGRGPLEFLEKNLEYRNRLDPHKTDFRNFQGEEEIVMGGLQIGFHRYWGGLMDPRDTKMGFVGPH